VINPGLTLLIRLNLNGLMRASWRRVRTPKGAISALVMAPLLMLFVGSQLYVAFFIPSADIGSFDPVAMRDVIPALATLMLVMEVWTGRALAFKPQELDFLFPAPVSRRELLAYHLLSRLPVRLLSALWISLFTMRMAPSRLGGLLMPLLGFTLLHVMTELVALLGAASSVWAGRWRSRLLWTVAAVGALWSVASAARAATGTAAALAALRTPVMRVLVLPMRPLGYIDTAAGPVGVLLWSGVVLLEIAAAVGVLFALDLAYTERAALASQRALERMKRAWAGQAVGVARPWKLRVRFPMPRILGDAAPMAWRQCVELIRTPRALMLPFVVPGLYMGLFMALPIIEGRPLGEEMVAGVVALSFFVPLLLPNIGFDFRRDVDRIATLRALPLHPVSVAAGQIFAPALAFVAAQVMVITAASLVADVISLRLVLGCLGVGIPLTWAVVALDNVLFLWMPYRFSTDGAQNVQFAGKTMVILAAKMLVLFLMAVLAALASRLTLSLSPGSWMLAGGAASLTLALGCIPLTWAAGALFQGFNLSSDLPA
jgi:hypothetical protein